MCDLREGAARNCHLSWSHTVAVTYIQVRFIFFQQYICHILALSYDRFLESDRAQTIWDVTEFGRYKNTCFIYELQILRLYGTDLFCFNQIHHSSAYIYHTSSTVGLQSIHSLLFQSLVAPPVFQKSDSTDEPGYKRNPLVVASYP